MTIAKPDDTATLEVDNLTGHFSVGVETLSTCPKAKNVVVSY
jgi:hypothetical protein